MSSDNKYHIAPGEVAEMARCLLLWVRRQPMSQYEISVVMGVSRGYVFQIEQRAMAKIRDAATRSGILA